jgi:hypothetical protein
MDLAWVGGIPAWEKGASDREKIFEKAGTFLADRHNDFSSSCDDYGDGCQGHGFFFRSR